MLDVLFVYRAKTDGHSIEELFSTISTNLPKEFLCDSITVERGLKLWLSIYRIYRSNSRVIHLTGGQNYLALFFPFKKIVLNLHDLNYYESRLSGLKKTIYKFFWVLLPILFSNVVITGSLHSRQQILENIPSFLKKKIQIIENCVNPIFSFRPYLRKNSIPLILHVGIDENKNLVRVIKSLRNINAQLYIIGKVPESILNLASQSNVFTSYSSNLSIDEVVKLYEKCDVVSFPSTAEGFGMPILEAQSIGRPVLTSNMSPMRDVAGTGACLVDPFSVESIRSGFKRLLNDENYFNNVVSAGRENALKYSPKIIVDKYINVYLSL